MAPSTSSKQKPIVIPAVTVMFWYERILIVTLILLPTWLDDYIVPGCGSLNIVLGFITSNVITYLECQEINPFTFELINNAVFYMERVGMYFVALNTFGLFKTNIGLHILELMQLFLIVRYIYKNYKHKCFQYCLYCLQYCINGLRLLIRGCIYGFTCWVYLWYSKDDVAKVNLLPDESKREEEMEDDSKDAAAAKINPLPDSKDAAVRINLHPDEPKRVEEMEDATEVESESESESMSETESEEEKTDSESEEEDEDETASESEEEDEDETASESEEESEDGESEDETDSESEEESEDETDSVSVKVGVKESKIMNHAMDLCTKLLREISELKENLTAKIENYKTKVEAERRKWEEEKENLSAKIKHYQSTEAEYAADRQKWDEEKEALNTRIQNCERELSLWEKHANFFQEKQVVVLNNYLKHVEEKHSLEVELEFNKKLVEEYKAYYPGYEGSYLKLREERLELASRLSTEISVAERLNRENGELEAKCRRLEEDKVELTGKLSAAREACELYRSYLRDLNTGFNSVMR